MVSTITASSCRLPSAATTISVVNLYFYRTSKVKAQEIIPVTTGSPSVLLQMIQTELQTGKPATSAPITNGPITNAPVATPTTDRPTISPSFTQIPSVPPTASSSSKPSISQTPTAEPSRPPTSFPTISPQPTDVPSTSSQPSAFPSTDPRFSPMFAPLPSPSTNITYIFKRYCTQILEVDVAEKFPAVQKQIYETLMESYTEQFGFMIGEPQIVTTCKVTDQTLAGRRRKEQSGFLRSIFERRELQVTTINRLVMYFTITYETKYDIEKYPAQFGEYVNGNLTKVTEDMRAKFLPVTNAEQVVVFQPKNYPTATPTQAERVMLPSMSPSSLEGPVPSTSPSLSPTTTKFPSIVPTQMPITPAPNIGPVDVEQGFIVGIAYGLGLATLVALLLIYYMRRKNQRKKKEASTAVSSNPNVDEVIQVTEGQGVEQVNVNYNQHRADYRPSSPQGTGTIADSIFSNPSMVSGGASFSSNSEENNNNVLLDPLQDEFDSYKNQDLEILRDGVEESVFGSEGIMSLAMTRALMEDEDADVNLSWGGAEDPESIEANGLCETNDWLRKHEHSTLDERNLFFQDILNRMVVTVRQGMISPSAGTRAIHCCAAVLGLQLEKETPNNVLMITGMRKTIDLSRGRHHLVEAFYPFGEIESAAIAPSNRGFGFVRFVSPRSVQRALERFRVSEIEVQDVSVVIKEAKSETLS